MLPRRRKLHTSEFPEIMSSGKTIHAPHLYIRVVFSGKDSKLAFVVPKKVVKGAIARNKIKRRGYNILKDLDIKPFKGIFFAKKGIQELSIDELSLEIKEILSKI